LKIAEGRAGTTSLDGLAFAYLASWPGPLHFGGGTAILLIDEKASSKQRELIENIAKGKFGGRPWPIFAPTIDKWLKTDYVPFDWKFDGPNSHVVAGEQLRVFLQPMRSPVTGNETSAKIMLPQGLLTYEENVTSTQTFSVFTDGLKYAWAGRNAWYATVEHGT
jgi:hypothetical protein